MSGWAPSSELSLDMPGRTYIFLCFCCLELGWPKSYLWQREGNYSALNLFFLGGALAPVIVWLLYKAFPQHRWIAFIHFPVLWGDRHALPPATTLNFNSWILVGTIFNYFIFKYRKVMWHRYNYVLSAALDAGLAFMTGGAQKVSTVTWLCAQLLKVWLLKVVLCCTKYIPLLHHIICKHKRKRSNSLIKSSFMFPLLLSKDRNTTNIYTQVTLEQYNNIIIYVRVILKEQHI